MNLTQKEIDWIVNNWEKISDEHKTYIKPNEYSSNVEGLKKEEHFVVLLVDRQKPSVVADYSFDEERVGVTKFGKVIWGFDSGCSCPSPWYDSYPTCYNVEKTWKEFEVKSKNCNFDTGWSEEAKKTFDEIKLKTLN